MSIDQFHTDEAYTSKPMTPRPLGISLLAGLSILGSVLLAGGCVYLAISDNTELKANLNTLGIPFSLLWIGIFLLAVIGFVGGIGAWTGKAWGWWLLAFYYVYGIARNANALYSVSVLATEIPTDSPRGPGYYYAKFAGRLSIDVLILIYLYKPNVLSFFGLSEIKKVKLLVILVTATFLLFVLGTILFVTQA
jgi:hypothetical protein